MPRDDEASEQETALTLHGLAEEWESTSSIRVKSRRTGALLEWPKPEQVGVVSMLLAKNAVFVGIGNAFVVECSDFGAHGASWCNAQGSPEP